MKRAQTSAVVCFLLLFEPLHGAALFRLTLAGTWAEQAMVALPPPYVGRSGWR